MMKQSILFLIAAGALSFGSKAHDHDHHHVPDWIFVENQGQWTGDFRYKAEIGPLAVFVEDGGMTWSLLQADALAFFPADVREVKAGEPVEIHYIPNT